MLFSPDARDGFYGEKQTFSPYGQPTILVNDCPVSAQPRILEEQMDNHNILDLFRLDNKVALITGAASGLGAAIATALAQAGASVAVHGNRRAADDTAAAIQAAGGHAEAFQSDLSSTTGAEALFTQVKKKFGRVDILINNAGTIHRNAAEDVALEDWQQVLQVNLTSVFQLAQLAGRDMISRSTPGKNAGKIVNIASLLSFQGGIRVPSYAASKGGVAQLTKALANEWAPKGIQVNAIAPGYFATTNTEALQADETRNRQILERIPAGRWGLPEDLAGAALYLSSPASNYVTGTILTVDGGWMGR
jgi:2-dehydro-3-deoxy-D-gluconate 5-dehydrogenase